MSNDENEYAKDDCIKEANFSGCRRHPFNELPCMDCMDEAKMRKRHEAAQANRASHFKRQRRGLCANCPGL